MRALRLKLPALFRFVIHFLAFVNAFTALVVILATVSVRSEVRCGMRREQCFRQIGLLQGFLDDNNPLEPI